MEHTNEKLIGKTILNSKGKTVGKIHELIKEYDSGRIVSVLVIPSKKFIHKKYSLTKNGEILFPFSSLSAVKDVFIIEDFVK
jgi:sporulation protein YlmC with PRC-barrel domain